MNKSGSYRIVTTSMPEFPDDLRFYLGVASLGAIAILSLLALFLAARSVRNRWRSSSSVPAGLLDREPRTLDQFYELFYSGEQMPRGAVLETVSRFASAAHVPAQFLKPDDTFSTVGSVHAEDRERFITDTAVLLQEAEERYGVSLFSGTLVTLDDYIRVNVLAARLSARTAAAGKK